MILCHRYRNCVNAMRKYFYGFDFLRQIHAFLIRMFRSLSKCSHGGFFFIQNQLFLFIFSFLVLIRKFLLFSVLCHFRSSHCSIAYICSDIYLYISRKKQSRHPAINRLRLNFSSLLNIRVEDLIFCGVM